MKILQTLKQNIEPIIVGAGLLTLVATTCLKDNVHFGSVTIKNPQRNQYTYGFFPIVDVKGNSSGNFYTVGLLGANNYFESNSTHNGNSTAAGLAWGYNCPEDGSTYNGNSTALGLLVGANDFEPNSTYNGNSTALGLLAGINDFQSSNLTYNGNSTAISLGLGINGHRGNSTRHGNSMAYGIVSLDSEGDYFLSHSIIDNSPKTNLEEKVQWEESYDWRAGI